MNILILGAGQVGSSLAEHLAKEDQNNLTIVDPNPLVLERLLRFGLDINTVLGCVSHPSVLKEARCDKADLIIAVSGDDEVNVLASKIAHRINPNAKIVCRILAEDYTNHKNLFDTELSGNPIITSFITPPKLVTSYIMRLIETPGALQTVDFAQGKLRLMVVRARPDGLLVNRRIREISKHLPANIDARFVAIFRNNQSIPTDGETIIQAGDEVSVIAEKPNIRIIMEELRRGRKEGKRVYIAGGGRIGYNLAQALEKKNYAVKIIDHNPQVAHKISSGLSKTVVIHGDASDPKVMNQENIESTDIFIAVTNSDESNIISSMLAKSLNCRKVMALVNQADYVPLLEQSQIDVAISPDQISISSILTMVRSSNIKLAYPLRRGAAEAMEIVLGPKSPTIGKRIDEIQAPIGINIGAIIRDEHCIIAHRNVIFHTDDHVILFVNSKKLIKDVQRLFCA